MRKAIITKYLGQTNFRCSRVTAFCDGGRVTISYDQGMNSDENHFLAAMKLAHKLGWYGPRFQGNWIAGGLPSNDGNVYVYNDGDKTTEFKIEGP